MKAVAKRFITPAVVAAGLALLYAWVSSLELDSIEQRTLNWDYLLLRTQEHLALTVLASAIVAILAIPLGIALAKTPSRLFRAIAIGLANIGRSIQASANPRGEWA